MQKDGAKNLRWIAANSYAVRVGEPGLYCCMMIVCSHLRFAFCFVQKQKGQREDCFRELNCVVTPVYLIVTA